MTTRRVLLFHTAFIGDIILVLPVLQELRAHHPDWYLAAVATPQAASIFERHPAVNRVIRFDKRGVDSGLRGMFRMVRLLRAAAFDVAIVPHRSLRSATIVTLAGIPRTIGFETSAGALMLTDRVPYRKDAHEIDRNLDLLQPLGIRSEGRELPALPQNAEAASFVLSILKERGAGPERPLIAVAPGSVWATKRWPERSYQDLCVRLAESGYKVILIGGESDKDLCDRIARACGEGALSVAGLFSLTESAALLRFCRVLVTNDSAPQHLAVAVGTPVVAIFGPTVPAFGFAPAGPRDIVVEVSGLSCRPCGIHGGDRCPLDTLDCMHGITTDMVVRAAVSLAKPTQEHPRAATPDH